MSKEPPSTPRTGPPTLGPGSTSPHGEPGQLAFYERVAAERPEINLNVQILPEAITPELLRDLSSKPGLLAIAMEEVADRETGKPTLRGVPFVVPGGRFNEFMGGTRTLLRWACWRTAAPTGKGHGY